MHRAYVEKLWIDSYINDESMGLPKDAEKRFFSVLRIKTQEKVAVFDGCGREVQGILAKDHQGAKFISSQLVTELPHSPQITLVQAAIDEPKLAETIKRGAEFGIDRIVIFEAKNSDRYCFEKLIKRTDRLMRLSIDASRQSGRLFVPQVEFVKSLDSLKMASGAFGIFGSLNESQLLSEILAKKTQASEIFIMVGPEGGLSLDEERKLKDQELIPVRFAPYVLRTELAHLAALSIINAWLKRA